MNIIKEIRETTGLALPLAIATLYTVATIYTTATMLTMATNG
jgi:hypothetical protein